MIVGVGIDFVDIARLGERLERIVRDVTRALEAAPTAKTRPA